MPSLSKCEYDFDEAALAPYRAVHDLIDARTEALVDEVRDFFRIPGFSTTGEGIRDSAEACRRWLESVGAEDIALVETGGWPVVTGVSRSK